MEDRLTLRERILKAYEADKAYTANKEREWKETYAAEKAARDLREAKLNALQDAFGNYGNFKYVDLEDFIDPDNQNWNDYAYRVFSPLVGIKGRVGAASPIGMFISHIRDAKNIDDVKKQLELWNSYKPLDLSHNGENYVNHFIYGLNKPQDYGGSRPVFPTTDEPDPVQTSTGGAQAGNTDGGTGTQGTQTGGTGGIPSTQGVQGAQAGAKPGNAVAGGGVQGSNNGSGKKPRMSDAEINAFLNEELGGDTTGNGTYASAGVAKGGTKTIGYEYDPNPNNVSLAYVMRNAPEQEQRDALINKWNKEHGRESVPYVPGTEIPAGSLNRSSSTYYASPGISRGGTYATGEGIKDANGNVLTNPGGDWEYQYALKNPQYGLGMTSKMSDAQRNYLQAVSDDMGYNYNFRGAPRYV